MKYTKAIALGLGLAAFASLSQAAEDPDRLWTDKQGRQIKAIFVGLDGDKISLQTPAGQVYSFALTNLTEADQALAKTIKTDKMKMIFCNGFSFASGFSRRFQGEFDVLYCCKPWQQRIALEDNATIKPGPRYGCPVKCNVAFTLAIEPGGIAVNFDNQPSLGINW